ncbi:hypothetical protein SAMD00019534_115490, partial [Acytostelium subglobosum LB1]|uniref:hypothetical protein n=1 Tax=Acytostelium subglobosum LB1 TaxID=1410327 RepID=UPI000645042E
ATAGGEAKRADPDCCRRQSRRRTGNRERRTRRPRQEGAGRHHQVLQLHKEGRSAGLQVPLRLHILLDASLCRQARVQLRLQDCRKGCDRQGQPFGVGLQDHQDLNSSSPPHPTSSLADERSSPFKQIYSIPYPKVFCRGLQPPLLLLLPSSSPPLLLNDAA